MCECVGKHQKQSEAEEEE